MLSYRADCHPLYAGQTGRQDYWHNDRYSLSASQTIRASCVRFGEEYHELSGRAKDLGSAAVFVSLTLVLMVWSAVAWSRFNG